MSVRRVGKWKDAPARLENGVKRGLILSGMLVAQRAQAKAPRDTGRLKRSLTRGEPFQSGAGRWAIDVGTNVIYAAAQEFGYTGVITEKQRWFFWYKYLETGNEMWLRLRFSYSYTIPAHPYLRPALDESKDEIRRLVLASVIGALTTRP